MEGNLQMSGSKRPASRAHLRISPVLLKICCGENRKMLHRLESFIDCLLCILLKYNPFLRSQAPGFVSSCARSIVPLAHSAVSSLAFRNEITRSFGDRLILYLVRSSDCWLILTSCATRKFVVCCQITLSSFPSVLRVSLALQVQRWNPAKAI